MTEQWPPEWDDPEPDDGHQDVELPELTAFLASVPSPALPASFEARISASIAAEAAARAADGTASHMADGTAPHEQEPSPAALRAHPVTSSGRKPRRRRPRLPSVQAASWVLVSCLILAGFGFLVTRTSSSSSSSEAASSASSAEAAAPAAGSGSGLRNSQAEGEHPAADEPSASSSSASNGFLVYSTGTAYQRSTLAIQVEGQLTTYGTATSGGTAGTAPVPADSVNAAASSSASSAAASSPSSKLTGCVSAVTDGVSPSLVDKASYDGTPAYIIATRTEAWVVGLGCTADDTDLIAQVPLKG